MYVEIGKAGMDLCLKDGETACQETKGIGFVVQEQQICQELLDFGLAQRRKEV